MCIGDLMLECCMQCRKRCEMNPYYTKNQSPEYQAHLLKLWNIGIFKRTIEWFKEHDPVGYSEWVSGKRMAYGRTHEQAMKEIEYVSPFKIFKV